ncbi:MAG: DUF1993 domain-containing protein [Tabrizicola sp.]|uniref:DUF1993 domain-containing protein n=1 Tax=Tabrizicola sp. TaxID=2005166 RepID=UPI002733BC0B|nr:DUF1993 domain-containing protein [Tabrizicola sp.]MDP3264340.1 DUF1993 domain-containing protein [Tabrizicola sp.]MDP3648615.1 DUF1993 domain-containing protein [Paracoccaceae bacterium]MDZ4067786.1 DUF1993 domain-containing protein [Tabrizicola sp.]
MYDHIIPPMDRTLGALSAILAKAEAHCDARAVKPEALLTFRLYPDMFPFTRQVQLACDFAARAAARLAGAEPKGFPDTEVTFAELKARIAAVRAYMAEFPASAYEAAATRPVTIKLRGEDMTMPGAQYLTMYSLPQFHFHAATAYNILRHNGVEVGKRDFMGAA